jgi:hypothetical protein
MNVQTLKSTVLWFEPLSGRLEGSGRPAVHERALASALTSRIGLPWPPDSVRAFWRYYLECSPPSRVAPWQAWERLVPLHRTVETRGRIEPKDMAGRFQIESFLYPHGIGLAVSVRIEEELELARMVDRVREILTKPVWKVSWGEKGSASLPAIASHLLAELAGQDRAPDDPGPTDPFHIATIFQADADPSCISQGLPPEDLRLALQGLCTLRQGWQKEDLRRLSQCKLRLRSGSSSDDLLFGIGRGRAVWFPRAFTADEVKNRTLGCYHRNLVLASMQTESLLQAVALGGRALSRGLLPVRLEEVTRRAALLLSRLYLGDGAYASWSVVEQIDHDRQLRETLGRVRDYFGLPAVRRTPIEDEAPPTAPVPAGATEVAAPPA